MIYLVSDQHSKIVLVQHTFFKKYKRIAQFLHLRPLMVPLRLSFITRTSSLKLWFPKAIAHPAAFDTSPSVINSSSSAKTSSSSSSTGPMLGKAKLMIVARVHTLDTVERQ